MIPVANICMILMGNAMTESNNVVTIDFKTKKLTTGDSNTRAHANLVEHPSPPKEINIPAETIKDAGEDTYKKFVTDPSNVNKIEFIMTELMKTVASQYPDIITCRFGDVLFLKEGVISLIMRAWLNEDHPFQNMADGLEKAFNKVGNNDSTK